MYFHQSSVVPPSVGGVGDGVSETDGVGPGDGVVTPPTGEDVPSGDGDGVAGTDGDAFGEPVGDGLPVGSGDGLGVGEAIEGDGVGLRGGVGVGLPAGGVGVGGGGIIRLTRTRFFSLEANALIGSLLDELISTKAG